MAGTPVGVLHVDDDPAMLQLLVAFLDRRPVETRLMSVPSGAEALDRLRSTPDVFDVVVSDYSLPDASDVAFLETVDAEFPDLPVIVFTGRADAEREARARGAVDFLVKGNAATLDRLSERIVEVSTPSSTPDPVE